MSSGNAEGLQSGAGQSPTPATCSLLEHAYTILHVDDIRARTAILGQDWAAKTLPPLREIAAENLRHDLDDAKQLQVPPSSSLGQSCILKFRLGLAHSPRLVLP